MINKFDKTNLGQVRIDINNALLVVMQKHGINLSIGNISFTSDGCEFGTKLTAKVKNSELLNSNNFVNLQSLGLPNDLIGKTISFKGVNYEVTGVNMKKTKFPVTTMYGNGQTSGFPVLLIKRLLLSGDIK